MEAKPRPGTPAVAYLRVSSQGQVGGHGFARQREAIRDFAKSAGYVLVAEYADAWTGTDANRPAFAEMLGELLANGCRTVIVESLDRFARDLGVQLALLAKLRESGVALVSAATGEDVTAAMAGDPMREAMVLVQGVFSQVEKRRLVAKLRKAREAIREKGTRCDGRKPYGEHTDPAQAVRERTILDRIRALRRGRMTWRAVAAQLNSEGLTTRKGTPWTPGAAHAALNRRRKEFASS
jgi:DNA invertase Pin-like site-specific DNA recombinase